MTQNNTYNSEENLSNIDTCETNPYDKLKINSLGSLRCDISDENLTHNYLNFKDQKSNAIDNREKIDRIARQRYVSGGSVII